MADGSFLSRLKARFSREDEEEREEKAPPIGKIRSLQILTLHESGMRFCRETELLPKGEEIEISLYRILFRQDEDRREMEERVLIPAGQALALLNDCRVGSWNGFNGPHPKGVRDGIVFRLNATVNGDRKIRATGSQCFPHRYRDFTEGLHAFLRGEN